MTNRLLRCITLLALASLAIAPFASADEPPKVQEPEFLGTFCYRDAKTGALSKLERQAPENRLHYAGAMGIGKAQGYMKIDGAKSPVRFSEGQPMEFVLLVPSQLTNPEDIIAFFAVESLKDFRRLTQSKGSSVFGITGDQSVLSESRIPYDAAKFGTSSFRITPSERLLPGEYILLGSNQNVAYCFGIDPDPAYEAAHLDQTLPFKTGEAIPVDLVERLVTIRSLEITDWPKPDEVQRAQSSPEATSSLTIKFTYANRGKRKWKCQFRVAIMTDKGAQLGVGEREATLGAEKKSDTDSLSVSIYTRDFPKAASLRVRVIPKPE